MTDQEIQKLVQENADLKKELDLRRNQVSQDKEKPTIFVDSKSVVGAKGTVSGRVSDNVGIAALVFDGRQLPVQDDGSFSVTIMCP